MQYILETKQELTSSNFSVADFASASSFSFLKNKEKNNTTKKSLQYYFYHQTPDLNKYIKSNRVASSVVKTVIPQGSILNNFL